MGLWVLVATALYPSGEAYIDPDVAWVLAHAGFHILDAGGQGHTVYRLAHQSFSDHWRRQVPDAVAAERAITEFLTEGAIRA